MREIADQRKLLNEKVLKAKKAQKDFDDRRKLEIGELAIEAGLFEIDNEKLKEGFLKIAESVS